MNIQEIKVKSAEMYLIGTYKKEGFYIVEDESKVKSFILVNFKNQMVFYIDSFSNIEHIINEPTEAAKEPVINSPVPEVVKNLVSQDFVLKLIAATTGKIEPLKL